MVAASRSKRAARFRPPGKASRCLSTSAIHLRLKRQGDIGAICLMANDLRSDVPQCKVFCARPRFRTRLSVARAYLSIFTGPQHAVWPLNPSGEPLIVGADLGARSARACGASDHQP